jgi:hypothetical protein
MKTYFIYGVSMCGYSDIDQNRFFGKGGKEFQVQSHTQTRQQHIL